MSGGVVGWLESGRIDRKRHGLILADKETGSQDGAMHPGATQASVSVSQKNVGSAKVIRSLSQFGNQLNCNQRPFH